MSKLIPNKQCALVELINKYEGIATLEGKYNDRISGVCISVGDEDHKHFIGKTLFWEEFKAGEVIEREGKKFCFILLEDIRGLETNETD